MFILMFSYMHTKQYKWKSFCEFYIFPSYLMWIFDHLLYLEFISF